MALYFLHLNRLRLEGWGELGWYKEVRGEEGVGLREHGLKGMA